MFSKVFGFSLLALATAQSFPITITNPSSSLWFIQNSLNTIAWTPCQGDITQQHPLFNVVVANSDSTLLQGNLSEIGAVNTFDCTKSFTPTNLPPGDNYIMYLFDSTSANLIAVSDRFSVMPQGSPYPTASTSGASGPTGTGGSAAPQQSGSSSSGSGSGSGNSTVPKNNNGAVSFVSSTQTALVALAGVAAIAITLL